MSKKLLALALALGLSLSLAACGGSQNSGTVTLTNPGDGASNSGNTTGDVSSTPETESTVLKVAATSIPHAEILEQVVGVLAEQGIELKVTEYGDYIVPNTAVEEGEEDVNYFQHLPYLDNFNAERGTHLVSVAGIHIEPMGVYAGSTASLAELPDGASVAVPNDATNEGRALLLLEAQGLIKLSESAGVEATPNDIAENPHNLKFVEVEAAMVPNVVSELDIAVINSNYAMEAGFNPVEDSLAIEDADSPYVNVLVIKEGNESNPAVQALIDALETDAVRNFILEKYEGAVVPVF